MTARLIRLLAMTGVALVVSGAPAPSSAQGFEFTDEEVEDFSEPIEFTEEEVDDGWGGEEDGWGEDVVEPVTAAPTTPTVTGLIVPTDALDAALAAELTQALFAELATIPGVEVVDNDALRMEFEIMGAELAFECAFDPVCLGRLGRQLGLTRVVIGRVNLSASGSGAWGTTVDLFETGSSSISNYRYFETEPTTTAVAAAMPAQIKLLFGIREERVGSSGPSGPSTAQVALAWSSAGIAVGGLAAGIAVGLKAKSIESDLHDCETTVSGDGQPVCTLSQRDASDDIDAARSKARLSNLLIGGGAFFGIMSVVLFSVTPGEDIDESAQTRGGDALRGWSLAPSFSPAGASVTGSFRF